MGRVRMLLERVRGRFNRILLFAFGVLLVVSVYFITVWVLDSREIKRLLNEDIDGFSKVEYTQREYGVKEADKVSYMTVDLTGWKERNPDVIGWLAVGGVNVDLPVVQTTDNDFYLDHDIDKKENRLGWVFVDARSDVDYPGLNTVIYGHNAMNRTMFGSLKGLLNLNETADDEQKRIYFTTGNKERVYDIVSVYITKFDDWDYIHQHYSDDEDRKSFLDKVERSNQLDYLSDRSVTSMDKILTLSTCYGEVGSTRRLVIHAKLISERDVAKGYDQYKTHQDEDVAVLD